MTIRYGCFFSYAHGRHELMQRFKATLADALRCYLEPYFDDEDELFVDTEQLGGGDDLDRKIARAMCESACMILIYTPKYEAHAYTRREYAAMRLLEAERGTWYPLPSRAIIPVIMTQHPDSLPPQVSESSFYVDFSRFTMATADLKSNPGLPAGHRQDGQADRHPLPVPEKMHAAGARLQPIRASRCPTTVARAAGTHLPQKMRILMETNRIAAGPARPGRPGDDVLLLRWRPCAACALAHAAWLLAGREQARTPVLMIDWDLEAPGLHHYFGRAAAAVQDERAARAGLLELFEACRERLRGAGRAPAPMPRRWRARARRLDWDDYIERVDDSRPLYLMRAGRFDDSYGERVDRLDWDALFCACPALFRSFAAQLDAALSRTCWSTAAAAARRRPASARRCCPTSWWPCSRPDPRSLDGLRGVVGARLRVPLQPRGRAAPAAGVSAAGPVDCGFEERSRWRFGARRRRHHQPRLPGRAGKPAGRVLRPVRPGARQLPRRGAAAPGRHPG
jgi:hypothetical protein